LVLHLLLVVVVPVPGLVVPGLLAAGPALVAVALLARSTGAVVAPFPDEHPASPATAARAATPVTPILFTPCAPFCRFPYRAVRRRWPGCGCTGFENIYSEKVATGLASHE
jgi:hypothetical protein